MALNYMLRSLMGSVAIILALFRPGCSTNRALQTLSKRQMMFGPLELLKKDRV